MTEFLAGPTMVLTWQCSVGNIDLASDFTSVEWSPTADMTEISKGSNTHKARMVTLKEASATVAMYGQSGGTQIASALGAGVSGTLIISPEGTATGKRKITMPAICGGAKYSFPFADKVAMSVPFSSNGTYTDGVY